MKIAPFAEDIFKSEYSAAGGTKGADPCESPFMVELCLIKVNHIKGICCTVYTTSANRWSKCRSLNNVDPNVQSSALSNDNTNRMRSCHGDQMPTLLAEDVK